MFENEDHLSQGRKKKEKTSLGFQIYPLVVIFKCIMEERRIEKKSSLIRFIHRVGIFQVFKQARKKERSLRVSGSVNQGFNFSAIW